MSRAIPYASYRKAERDADFWASTDHCRWVVLDDLCDVEFLVMRESNAEELMKRYPGQFEIRYTTGETCVNAERKPTEPDVEQANRERLSAARAVVIGVPLGILGWGVVIGLFVLVWRLTHGA